MDQSLKELERQIEETTKALENFGQAWEEATDKGLSAPHLSKQIDSLSKHLERLKKVKDFWHGSPNVVTKI